MGSDGLISRCIGRLMPFWAILVHEFRSLSSNWLVRLWLGGSALLTLLVMATRWRELPTAPLIAALLVPYLIFPWFLVVMLLGISPVTGSRLESLADGILSRPVTRYEYLIAAWAARVVAVLLVFLLVMVPASVIVTIAKRPVPEDAVTVFGIVASLSVAALVLTFLVSLGFLVGTLVRRSLMAAVVLIFVWLPVNLILHTFSLEELSPISLNQALPTLLRTPWRTVSGEKNVVDKQDLDAVARQAARFLSVLSGEPQVADRPRAGFFEQREYKDFCLTRVALGYGLPTLAAIGLAALCFCWRDL